MPTTLRRAVDAVCALSVAGLIGGVLYFSNQDVQQRQTVSGVADELERFRQVLMFRSAQQSDPDLNARGWPTSIDPSWFGDTPPRNSLVTPDRPWVEIATQDQASLKDPVVRMTVNPFLASFWYNPYQEIIRARVPVGINDKKALEMYNSVNSTALSSIYASSTPGSSGSFAAPAPTGASGPTGAPGATGAQAPGAPTVAAPEHKEPGKH